MSLLDDLAPIGLPELTSRAALLTRLDRKYLVPLDELPALIAALAPSVRVLDADGQRSFAYQSAYFDSPSYDCYLSTAHRRRRRFKVRLRTYVDSGQRYLEVKTRDRRGHTVKTRFPYAGTGSLAQAQVVVNSDLTGYRTALTTTYRRATLFAPDSGSRLTIDTGLSWADPSGKAISVPGLAIVETKSAHATTPIDRLLWSLKYRPCPVSKYGTGLAALRPELPSHRWRPVLRRYFPTPPLRLHRGGQTPPDAAASR